jgi:hypothetical protein
MAQVTSPIGVPVMAKEMWRNRGCRVRAVGGCLDGLEGEDAGID